MSIHPQGKTGIGPNGGPPLDDLSKADPRGLLRVMTVPEWAKSKSISLATAKRIIRRGQGPTLTRLSPGRWGVQVRHDLAWLKAREVIGAPDAAALREAEKLPAD